MIIEGTRGISKAHNMITCIQPTTRSVHPVL